jgi:hypothetical protein
VGESGILKMNKIWKLLLGSIIVVHLIFLVSLKFTAWPEMLVWPYLIIKGWLPYANIAIAHTPLLLIKLAVFYKLFGVGVIQLKIFTWLLVIFTDLLVYFVASRLWGKKTGILSVAAFAVWQLFFDGNGLWFDLVVVPISILTFYLLTKRHYFWAGVFWAFMFFTKQTAIWFLIPIGIKIVQSTEYRVQSTERFLFGSLGILVVGIAGLGLWGVLPSFYKWAIDFGVFILPKAAGQVQLPDLKNLLVSVFPFLIFIPLILKTKVKNLNLLLWAMAGSIGAYPRFEYFHFQPAIPFLAFASGLLFSETKKLKNLIVIFIAFYFLGCTYLLGQFLIKNWKEGTRFYEQDVQDVAVYIKANVKTNSKIFVMNWWDSLYALTDTLPAVNPWVPQLSWYQEIPGVQDKEVADLQNSNPKMIIQEPYSELGLSSYIPQKVYSYILENYKIKEKVDGLTIFIPKNK